MEHPLIQIAEVLVREMRQQDGLDYRVERREVNGEERICLLLDGEVVKGPDDLPIAFLPNDAQDFLYAVFEFRMS